MEIHIKKEWPISKGDFQCGLLDNKLIEPCVFDNNLTGYTYEFFLRMSYQDC